AALQGGADQRQRRLPRRQAGGRRPRLGGRGGAGSAGVGRTVRSAHGRGPWAIPPAAASVLGTAGPATGSCSHPHGARPMPRLTALARTAWPLAIGAAAGLAAWKGRELARRAAEAATGDWSDMLIAAQLEIGEDLERLLAVPATRPRRRRRL